MRFKYTKEDAASWPLLFRDLAASIELLHDARDGSGSAMFVADVSDDKKSDADA